MKNYFCLFFVMFSCLLFAGDEEDDQTFSIAVNSINELDISSGGTITLTIDGLQGSGTPGDPWFDTDTSTTYSISENSGGVSPLKITGNIDTAISGVTYPNLNFYVQLGNPSIGSSSSAGFVLLNDALTYDLVTGINTYGLASSVLITYKLEAQIGTPNGTFNRTVTLTLTN